MGRKVERTGEVKGVGEGCLVLRFHVLWRMAGRVFFLGRMRSSPLLLGVSTWREFQAGRPHSTGQNILKRLGPGVASNCDDSETGQARCVVGIGYRGRNWAEGEAYIGRMRGYIF